MLHVFLYSIQHGCMRAALSLIHLFERKSLFRSVSLQLVGIAVCGSEEEKKVISYASQTTVFDI